MSEQRERFNACWRAIAEGDPSGFAIMRDMIEDTGDPNMGQPIPTIADEEIWDEHLQVLYRFAAVPVLATNGSHVYLEWDYLKTPIAPRRLT